MRERTRLVMTAGDRLRRGSDHRHGIRRRCAVGRASNDDALEGVADLWSRSRRHALFAAESNHSGECRPARSGVGVSHEARRLRRRRTAGPPEPMPPRRHPGAAAGDAEARASVRARSRHSSSTGRCTSRRRITGSWQWTRAPVRRSGRFGSHPETRRPEASSTGRATRRLPRKSSSARPTASCTRSTRRPGRPTRPSVPRASSRFEYAGDHAVGCLAATG